MVIEVFGQSRHRSRFKMVFVEMLYVNKIVIYNYKSLVMNLFVQLFAVPKCFSVLFLMMQKNMIHGKKQ